MVKGARITLLRVRGLDAGGQSIEAAERRLGVGLFGRGHTSKQTQTVTISLRTRTFSVRRAHARGYSQGEREDARGQKSGSELLLVRVSFARNSPAAEPA